MEGATPHLLTTLVPQIFDNEDPIEGFPGNAILLFTDMQGYSRLCAEMIAENTRAAEDVGDMLNSLAGGLADCVAAHGGSVVAFAGDATLSIWRDADKGAAKKAVAAAKQMAQLAEDAERPMRVLLDFGPITGRYVLAGQHRAPLIDGPLINALAQTGDAVIAGRIGATTAFRELHGGLSGRGTVSEVPRGPNKDDHKTQLSISRSLSPDGLVPPQVAKLIMQADQARDARWVSEFRMANILFVYFGLETAYDDVETLISQASDAINNQNGCVLSVLCDDKGYAVIGAWGLAFNAFEDDAARAISAALEIDRLINSTTQKAGIGLARGEVFAGLIGGTFEKTYTLVGQAVNLASVLSRQSELGIWASAEVAVSAERHFAFDQEKRIIPKGTQKPVTICSKPRAHLRTIDSGAPFVGRQDELSSLLAAIKQEGGATLILEGQAGIGKSKLSSELRHRLTDQKIPWFLAQADSLRRAEPLHVLQPIIFDLLPQGDGLALAREALGENAAFLPLINAVLPEQAEENDIASAIEPGSRGGLARQILAELLSALWPKDQRLLIIDDCHWCDSASWSVLEDFSRRRPDLKLLLQSRPIDRDALTREALSLITAPDVRSFPLGPLDANGTAALAASVIGASDLPKFISEFIHATTEGHPLYTAELARTLVDKAVILVSNGIATSRLDRSALTELALPDGVKGVVAERFARLDPDVQLTAKTAATLGRRFSTQALDEIHPSEQRDLTLDIDTLMSASLVEPIEGEIRFRHAIIQQVAYDLLLRDQRLVLHRAAAEWFTKQAAQYPQKIFAPSMAYHWGQAEVHDQAMSAFAMAADHASATGALGEVAKNLEHALAHAAKAKTPPQSDVLAGWHFKCGKALQQLGFYQNGIARIRETIRRLDRPFPKSAIGLGIRAAQKVVAVRRKPKQGPPIDRDRMLTAASAYHTLAEISYEHDNLPQTLAAMFSGLDIASRAGGDSPAYARLLMASAFVGLSAPLLVDAQKAYREAMAMGARIDEPSLWSWLLFVASNFNFGHGKFVETIDLCWRSIETSQQIGSLKDHLSGIGTLANAYRVEGRIRESAKTDFDMLELAQDRGNLWGEVLARTALIKCHIFLNDYDVLAEEVRRVEAIFDDPLNKSEWSIDNYMTVPLGKAVLAESAGKNEEAFEHFKEMVRCLDQQKSPAIYGLEPTNLALALSQRFSAHAVPAGDLIPEIKKVVRYAKRLSKQYSVGRSKTMLAEGDLAHLQSNQKLAQQRWLSALEEAKIWNVRFDEAEAHRRLGHMDEVERLLSELNIPRPILWTEPTH